MNVADTLDDNIRTVVRAELASRGVKRPALAKHLKISIHRLNHMLAPPKDDIETGTKKPTRIPPGIIEGIRKYLENEEGWPISALRSADTPGYLSVHEERSTSGYVSRPPTVVEGSERPRNIPAEFAGSDWQIMVMPDDSMMKGLQPGDVLAVATQLKIRVGYPHCILIAGKPTVRIIEHDGRDYVVTALNPKYPTAALDSEHVGLIVGRVWMDENGDRQSRLNPLGLKV